MTPLLLSLVLSAAPAPAEAPLPRQIETPAVDRLDVIFYTRTRPLRLQMTVTHGAQTMGERWRAHVRTLFAASDRDRNGFLDEKEADTIIPVSGIRQLFQGGYYYRVGNQPPELKALDLNGDGKVSLDELRAYYREIAADLVKPRPSVAATGARDAGTEELYARLDRNKDGKLTEAELRVAERILGGLDADEDECVSLNELLQNRSAPANVMVAADAAMMARPTTARATQAVPQDLVVFQSGIPGTVVQQLLKHYDGDGDFELSRQECGFDAATFDRLDKNTSGKLSATELDGWRTERPDGTVAVVMAETNEGCKVTATPAGAAWPKDFDVRQTEPGRVVLRVGKQTIEFGTNAPPGAVSKQRTSAFLNGVYPQGKDTVTEADITGPQFQLLRVVFDATDANGDGKLTRKEFEKYFETQRATAEIALGVNYSTRTPNFFQMLDDNLDGKLSVRELRTAWDRLIVLEPGEGKAVTRAVMQPSANLRVTRASLASDPGQIAAPQGARTIGADTPLWHRKMDRNADGDVSKAEFLGDADAFAKLDTNADGLVSTGEALAFEKVARPKKK